MSCSNREKQDKQMLRECLECCHTVSNEAIMKAKKKPNGVSDIRWKMELRRRRNAAFYSLSGDAV